METKFGRLLRRKRQEAGKTMGDLAKFLDVSVPYISDVERGNRKAFPEDRIMAIAGFLSTAPYDLIVAAAEDGGEYRLQFFQNHPKRAQVGAALMRRWTGLTDEQLIEIEKILGRQE